MIEVDRVETSCPCLTVELRERCAAPNEFVQAIIRVDLSEDPEFTGGLGPEFEFFDAQNTRLLAASVRANVVPQMSRVAGGEATADALGSHSDAARRVK